MKQLAAFVQRNVQDLAVFGGLTMVGSGIALLSVAWALIVVGAVLCVLGLLGIRRRIS